MNLYFISVVDVLAYKYVRLVVFTPIHGKMCSYIGLLILSFLQHSQPKTKTEGGGGGDVPLPLLRRDTKEKKRKEKRKKNRFCLSLILRFPRHTETFLYT